MCHKDGVNDAVLAGKTKQLRLANANDRILHRIDRTLEDYGQLCADQEANDMAAEAAAEAAELKSAMGGARLGKSKKSGKGKGKKGKVKVCQFYLRNCANGEDCPYLHLKPEAKKPDIKPANFPIGKLANPKPVPAPKKVPEVHGTIWASSNA